VTIKKKRKTKEENKSDKVLEQKDEKRSMHLQDTPEKKKPKIDGIKKLLRIKDKKKK
jgi:hypothetical protein